MVHYHSKRGKIMSRNKSINQLISKIILAGLLIGTLPASLSLRGQAVKEEDLKNLKMTVDRDITQIKKTVAILKTTNIVVPGLVIGLGVIATVAATVGATLLFLIPRNNLIKALERHKNILSGTDKNMAQYLLWVEPFLLSKGMLPENLRPKNISQEKLPEAVKLIAKTMKSTIQKRLNIMHMIIFGLPLGAITVVFLGLIGTVGGSIASFFASSSITIATAVKGAEKIKQIKKEHPGIVTPQQERILAQFKKLSKGMMARAIIQNAQLHDALKKIVDDEIMRMQKKPMLIDALGGHKRARTIITNYIKLSLQIKLFEEALAQGAGFIKSALVKLQLKNAKKKIANLESRHPALRTRLETAVKAYATKTEVILNRLRQQVFDAAQKGKLEKMPATPRQVVPL